MAVLHRVLFLFCVLSLFFLDGSSVSANRPPRSGRRHDPNKPHKPHKPHKPSDPVVVVTGDPKAKKPKKPSPAHHVVPRHRPHKPRKSKKHGSKNNQAPIIVNPIINIHHEPKMPKQDTSVVVVTIPAGGGADNKPVVLPIPDTPSKPEGYKPNPKDPDPAQPYAGLGDVNNKPYTIPEIPKKPAAPVVNDVPIDKQAIEKEIETKYLGEWKLHNNDAFVSAMHMQLLPNNKAIMFDTTAFGPSKIQLPQPHPANCLQRISKPGDHPAKPPAPEHLRSNQTDCWAHAVEYDVETAAIRPLKVLTDTWCSSGGLSPEGFMVNTGGWEEGVKAVRHMCATPGCDFVENPFALVSGRWYSTQATLEDGSFVVVGGRNSFSYELVPWKELKFPQKQFDLLLLKETNDPGSENNLYPFVNLAPDGNIYIFANKRSILVEPCTGKVLREFPVLPGGARNYPGSAMSTLLPLDLTNDNKLADAEVLICGGAPNEGWLSAEKQHIFLPALQDCGRISLTKPDAKWEIDQMPTRRVMGDMHILPTTKILIINGAKAGVSGWQFADDPNLTPLLYDPMAKLGERFKDLQTQPLPRMYHSSSVLLPEGTILVAGSNTNPTYNFTEMVRFKTLTSVEKYYPPYLDPALAKFRPLIEEATSDKKYKFGQQFKLKVKLDKEAGVSKTNVKVTMLAPAFTTHGYGMGQRMVVLKIVEATDALITVVAPPSGKIAPPGYYMLSVVHRGLPSKAMWVQLGV